MILAKEPLETVNGVYCHGTSETVRPRMASRYRTPAGKEPAMTETGLFEAMYSARALRRLKPNPVPEALITKVLEAATQAPSGGNAQNWIFVVVRDAAQRSRLGAV